MSKEIQLPGIPTEQTIAISSEDILLLAGIDIEDSDDEYVSIKKKDLDKLLDFISESFTDAIFLGQTAKKIGDDLQIEECFDKEEEKIRYGKCTKVLMKLMDKREIEKLKVSFKELVPIFGKYKQIYDTIKILKS